MKKIKLKVELGLIDKLRIRINGYIKICDDLFLVKCSKCNNHFFDHLRGYNNYFVCPNCKYHFISYYNN